MSVKNTQYGCVSGIFDQDARCIVKGPGKKVVLAMIASYQVNNIVLANNVIFGASSQLWGRLQVFDGLVDPPGEVTALTPVFDKLVFDAAITTPGPHTFLFPISSLWPNPSSSQTISVILSRVQSVAGNAIQNILVSGGAGTFTVTFQGAVTGALAWNAADAVVQAALNGLPTIVAAGGVTVTHTVPAAGLTLYSITFNASGTQSGLTALGAAGATATVIFVNEGGPLMAWAPLLTVYGIANNDNQKFDVRG